MNLFEKVADAYQAEIERLFVAAEAKGMVFPAFTAEKRAAYYEIEKAAGPVILAELDAIALDSMTPLEQIAIYGGLGKLAGLGSWYEGAKTLAKGVLSKVPWKKAPTSAFMGLGEGASHWAQMRKVLGKPAVAPGAHSIMGDLKSGLAFGGAFGGAQRLLAPKEEPKVEIGS